MGTNKINCANIMLGYVECPSHVLFSLISLDGLN